MNLHKQHLKSGNSRTSQEFSFVGVDCEKFCRSDHGVFVVKDGCHKNQQTLLLVPWTGRTTIEETCDEFEGHLMYLTQSEESLIKNSCSKTWRVADSKLVKPRILATKTGSRCRKKRVLI